MTRRIPLIARNLKRLYTGFLLVALVLFLVCTYLTEFNPMVLAENGDAFWEFITEDFLPPALAESQPHTWNFFKRACNAGSGHVRHYGGCHPGIFCGPVRQ